MCIVFMVAGAAVAGQWQRITFPGQGHVDSGFAPDAGWSHTEAVMDISVSPSDPNGDGQSGQHQPCVPGMRSGGEINYAGRMISDDAGLTGSEGRDGQTMRQVMGVVLRIQAQLVDDHAGRRRILPREKRSAIRAANRHRDHGILETHALIS